MRRSLIAFALGVLLLACAPMQAEELAYSRLADYLEALRLQVGIPGLAAAVVGPTEVLWERGFGYQDVARALPMRPDTPLQIDGITQVFTATFVLQCAESNRIQLDDLIGAYTEAAPEPNASLRQLLSHTSGPRQALTFAYRSERLDALDTVISRCEGETYRSVMGRLLERLAMVNSVPGADVLNTLPPPDAAQSTNERARYAAALDRLSTAYAVDGQKRAVQVQFTASTLTPSTGLISTAHDYAQFDLALRSGILMSPQTLAEAWRPAIDGAGRPLPHALGWFVQNYNGDMVVWQFGSGGENGSSSLVVTLPGRGMTMILMANSTGLVKSLPLARGDVTTSPFARVFLSLFTR